ncbi:MAG: hypothetical protein GY774_17640 [Planctomycetes bacterium]|nr:hypothetical protein [Planctomycetota bacterium]
MTKQEYFFKLFLRIIGTTALFAIVAVVMPYSWMNATHKWLGMGELPSEPIVGYLARSTSAFYAILGGLFWLVSFDLNRHRLVLGYLGIVIVIFGAALFIIDLLEGMPLSWSLTEGPFNLIFGVVIFVLSYRIGVKTDR